MYKVVVVSFFLIICLVNGENNPKSEVEHVGKMTDTKTETELNNMLKKIADEMNKLKGFLESTKNNMADGQKSDFNINKLLAMPKDVANLTSILQSTINALEKKELLG